LIYYFAYGSNLSRTRLETDRLKPEGVRLVSRRLARLEGYELVFDKPSVYFPGAGAGNIRQNPSATILGTLNQMPEAGLRVLDVYENVASGQYERLDVSVYDVENAQYIDAVTYIARNNLGADLRPRRTYLDYLLADRDVLPADYIAKLAEVPLCPEIGE
jgi:gamma-glutamylcyclotransferase